MYRTEGYRPVCTWILPVLAATCLGPTLAAQSADVEGGPLNEPFEIKDLLTTWRNLGNEQVMFPLDMADIAARIGPHRQLFLDNDLIAKAKRVTRQVHRPKRYEGNPVVRPLKWTPPERANRAVAGYVMQFKTAPRFRMWYWSYPSYHKLPTGQRIRFAVSYAISDDGMTWRKPKLNLHKIKGSRLPSIVIPYGLMHGLFYEPDDPDPQKRFKALICVERKNPMVREGYYLHTSPDGIRWKGDLDRCVIPSLKTYSVPQDGVGDTTRFWWDPIRRKYIGDVKFVIYGKMRARGTMESDDLIHWSRAPPTFSGRVGQTEIYGHRGFAYQGMYVGMRWIYVRKRSKAHSTNVELDCSRDGRIWTRVGTDQPFMAFNPKRDTWDAGKMRPIAMLEVGEEIWIYYHGMPTDLERSNPNFPEAKTFGNCVGLAKLPRDRFASINGGPAGGILLTRPMAFAGRKLHVNADVAAGGGLTVAVLDYRGAPLPGYGHGDCPPIKAAGFDLPVSWKTKADLAGLAGSDVRLQFRLRNAKLFSFWIE